MACLVVRSERHQTVTDCHDIADNPAQVLLGLSRVCQCVKGNCQSQTVPLCVVSFCIALVIGLQPMTRRSGGIRYFVDSAIPRCVFVGTGLFGV